MRLKASKTLAWVAMALVIGLSITIFATWRQVQENRRAAEAAVKAAAESVADDVVERLFLYQYGMRGVRGAVLTAGEYGITNQIYQRYSRSRDIDREFPGARGFGFVRRVPVADEAKFLERVRAEGRSDYRIIQLSPTSRERWVIESIEPVDRNAAAVGLDIASDPYRREAAEVAMRTGETAISAPITLLQNPDQNQKSFLLMMPIYRPGLPTRTPEEREANTFGWSYAALSMNDVMNHLRLDHERLHLVLRDVTRPDEEHIIYETADSVGNTREYVQRLERSVFGRQWMVEVDAHPAFVEALNLTRPRSVAIIGILASLLLATLIGAESVSRRRKHLIAVRMADFNAQLERQVVERTEELTYAKAAAEAANAAKGRFLAIMSHELRTPMSGVLGMGDLLMSSELKPEQQRLMHTLMGSARTLLDLLNDILDFAKIEAGRVDLEEVDFSIRQVVGDVREVLAPLASAKGNIIETRIDGTLPSAQRGDAKRYRQILMNLVGNANKFTKKGSICIDVKASSQGDDVLVETTVTDTGVGIAADNRDRLFQPFVQEDTSTSRKFGGTGLGLAISKTLAELMGGRIWFESEPGVGSAFSFTVTLRNGDIAKVVRASEISRGAVKAVTAARPLRVLVAEDNETNRMLAIRLLSRMGHTVTAVENGAAAVTEFGRAAFDVILMDMQMPVMDGPAAMQIIRTQQRAPVRIPIIALTADAMREHHREYLEAGADVIMTKPVDWAMLAAEMDRMTRSESVSSVRSVSSAPAAESTPVLNDALLVDMLSGLGDELPPLLDRMTLEANRLTDALRQAATRGEADVARRTAHALKGLSSQFGAARLAAVAGRVEQAAKRGENVEPLLAEVEAVGGEAFTALRAWRQGAARPSS